MYVAMNRFRVNEGHEEAFENVWRNRNSSLADMAGFQSFHLLKGAFDEESKTTLYASHTIWESHDNFVDWTKSQNFRDAHKNAGTNKGMYAGHPQFEGFQSVVDS
ncbi:MAG: antibiotic biosynthesis monooxygenase [Ahrensia sp.]|nr:antibiotic biosynthesis monooxygenase [Ahrensia sp.]